MEDNGGAFITVNYSCSNSHFGWQRLKNKEMTTKRKSSGLSYHHAEQNKLNGPCQLEINMQSRPVHHFVLRLLMIILLGADMKVAFSYKLDFPLLPGIAWLMSGGGVRDAFSIRNKYAAIDCSQCVCSGQGQGRS
jgi:hypothetical protein